MAKILLAEDDTDMRRFLVKALQNAGFDVTSYDNGLSAYQRLREEHYEVLEATASGDRVALQVRWTGVLAAPVGALKPGDTMVCHSGIFLRFHGDRIVEQHNYDCFEDFTTPRD